MSDNEFWIRFWLSAFSAIVCIVIVTSVIIAFTSNTEEYGVKDIKFMLDSGYTKQVIGCDKPVYGFIKDTK